MSALSSRPATRFHRRPQNSATDVALRCEISWIHVLLFTTNRGGRRRSHDGFREREERGIGDEPSPAFLTRDAPPHPPRPRGAHTKGLSKWGTTRVPRERTPTSPAGASKTMPSVSNSAAMPRASLKKKGGEKKM